jgi:hypothetical protein
MKSINIVLSPERSEKLKAITESIKLEAQAVHLADRSFTVEPRKVSASAIAASLLNAAIDDAHAHI